MRKVCVEETQKKVAHTEREGEEALLDVIMKDDPHTG